MELSVLLEIQYKLLYKWYAHNEYHRGDSIGTELCHVPCHVPCVYSGKLRTQQIGQYIDVLPSLQTIIVP